jgi:hypothetical protein
LRRLGIFSCEREMTFFPITHSAYLVSLSVANNTVDYKTESSAIHTPLYLSLTHFTKKIPLKNSLSLSFLNIFTLL